MRFQCAAGDRFVSPEQVAAFRRTAKAAGANLLVREYDGAGHYFTDESHPDYSPTAAGRTRKDVLTMGEA